MIDLIVKMIIRLVPTLNRITAATSALLQAAVRLCRVDERQIPSSSAEWNPAMNDFTRINTLAGSIVSRSNTHIPHRVNRRPTPTVSNRAPPQRRPQLFHGDAPVYAA